MRAATRAAGAARFAPAQVLDPGAVKQAGAPGELGAAIAADGTATVAWSAYTRQTSIAFSDLRAATARPGRRFGPPQTIAETGIDGLSDFAASPSGAAVATWTAYPPGRGRAVVMAAVRPAGAGAFGPPEVVAPARHSVLNPVAPAPVAAIDDAGKATIAWAAEDVTGEPPLHVPMSAVLRLATR